MSTERMAGIADAIERVRALHRETSEEGITQACAEGDCDHPEAIRGEDCPTKSFQVCHHCMGIAEDLGVNEEGWPGFVMYPCATIRALDAGSVLALLNGGSA